MRCSKYRYGGGEGGEVAEGGGGVWGISLQNNFSCTHSEHAHLATFLHRKAHDIVLAVSQRSVVQKQLQLLLRLAITEDVFR